MDWKLQTVLCKNSVSFARKAVDVLRILVTWQILVLGAFYEKFERDCIYSTEKHSKYNTQEELWHWPDAP